MRPSHMGFVVTVQDAVRCIVGMVTDDSGGGEEGAESLFNDLVRHGDDPAVCKLSMFHSLLLYPRTFCV